MLYYFLLLSFLCIGVPNLPQRIKNFLFVLSGFLLIFFCAFRGDGNGDYFTYIEYSKLITSFSDLMNFNFPMEIGFRFLSLIGNLLGLHQQFIIVSLAFISVGLVLIIVKKYSLNPNLSLVVFFPMFLMMDMHASRTAVSAVFGFLSIISMIEKKSKRSLFYFFLAISFHFSAIILVLLPFALLPLPILFLILIFSIIFSVSIGAYDLLVLIVDLIDNPLITYKFYNYLANPDYSHKLLMYDPRIIWPIIISVCSFSLIKVIKNHFLLKLMRVYIVGTCAFIFFSDFALFAIRLSHFFMITSIIIIPGVCFYFDRAFSTARQRMFISSYASLSYYLVLSTIILFSDYVEYKFFFR